MDKKIIYDCCRRPLAARCALSDTPSERTSTQAARVTQKTCEGCKTLFATALLHRAHAGYPFQGEGTGWDGRVGCGTADMEVDGSQGFSDRGRSSDKDRKQDKNLGRTGPAGVVVCVRCADIREGAMKGGEVTVGVIVYLHSTGSEEEEAWGARAMSPSNECSDDDGDGYGGSRGRGGKWLGDEMPSGDAESPGGALSRRTVTAAPGDVYPLELWRYVEQLCIYYCNTLPHPSLSMSRWLCSFTLRTFPCFFPQIREWIPSAGPSR